METGFFLVQAESKLFLSEWNLSEVIGESGGTRKPRRCNISLASYPIFDLAICGS